MIDILRSPATETNPHLADKPRKRGESNVDWLQRLRHTPSTDRTLLLLVGGISSTAMRVRAAQCLARYDMRPSHWSHVAMLDATKIAPSARLLETSLEGDAARGFPPETNAVGVARLKDYADPVRFPNIALLSIPVSTSAFRQAVKAFSANRASVDAVELLLVWLAHVWGADDGGNPLARGEGLPSAVMVEYASGAADFELTPGLASRASCPEAIWQTAKWWHVYHETLDVPDEADAPDHTKCVTGWYTCPHQL